MLRILKKGEKSQRAAVGAAGDVFPLDARA
jgi:hypothetical protein